MALTGNKIQRAIDKTKNSNDFANELAKAIVANLEITIPIQKVVTTVVGGSGAPAIATKNVTPIKCGVK